MPNTPGISFGPASFHAWSESETKKQIDTLQSRCPCACLCGPSDERSRCRFYRDVVGAGVRVALIDNVTAKFKDAIDASMTVLACLWAVFSLVIWALRIDSEPMESRWR
jgi:hypothetical protein